MRARERAVAKTAVALFMGLATAVTLPACVASPPAQDDDDEEETSGATSSDGSGYSMGYSAVSTYGPPPTMSSGVGVGGYGPVGSGGNGGDGGFGGAIGGFGGSGGSGGSGGFGGR
jgi:hypothetical protein